MNELSRTEKWLEKAFELAYFIHGDIETAKHIAFNAMNKLEVASNAQYKRFYYSPEARKSRNKVSMNDLQLLQRLVYVESEAFEKEKEFTATATEKDLLIYFIKHLIRITLKRNSFYVTLGLSRILHNYATTEAMEIYNVVVQDPEKVHDDYYYRSRKGVLMKELKNRFGEKLEITNVNRGEQRFQASGYSEVEAELVQKCLKSFTPWNTECNIPENFNPHFETLNSLCFTGKNADDEHRIELNRMHVLLNPETFQRVVNSLSFPLPQEKLELPKFNMKKKNQNTDPNDDTKNPPSLDDADLKQLTAMLDQEAARRKSASCGLLRVVVDGEEKSVFDTNQNSSQKFEIDQEFDELIEVYSVENGRDLLVATYMIGGDDEFVPSVMFLEEGQKISFSFNESVCQIGFAETRLKRSLARWWRKNSAKIEAVKILRPAMATFGILLACLLGIIFVQNSNTGTLHLAEQTKISNFEVHQIQIMKVEPIKINNPNEFVTSNKNPAQKIAVEKSLKKEPVKPNSIVSIPTKIKKPILPNSGEISENVEVSKFPILEKREDSQILSDATRSSNEAGKSLKNIKYVYVEVTGDDKYGRQIGEQLMDKLNQNKRFLAVNNRDKADGLLKVSVRRESDNGKDETAIVSAVVRLVNSDGFVVFPNKKKVSAWKYVGNATKIPAQIVKDLAERK